MPSNPIVRTIARAQAPDGPHVQGVYLQMDGTGVNGPSRTGYGRLRAGHGAGVFDQFRMSPRPTDGSSHLTTFESVTHPNVYLRMDGSGVSQPTSLGGGIVNMSWGKGQNEEFYVRYNANGTVSFESKAFPGVFLRLSMGEIPGETGISVNCQHGSAGEFEQFRLEEPPATARLRLLTYNLHLMKDSFIEQGSDAGRAFKTIDRTVFEDDARRERIIRYALAALPDILAFQEVWAPDWADWFKDRLLHAYPYIYLGQTRWDILTRTSGLVLASKYPLSDYQFKMFRGMKGHEADSNKGVITVVADIPTVGKLRIGTTHTSGEDGDIEALARQTVLQATPAQQEMPAILFGDFNKSWKINPLDPGFTPKPEYGFMRRVFAFPGKGIHAATDAWVDVHGTGLTPHPFTIGMATNKLAQTFSPERDTEPYDRIDYFWVKPGKQWGLALTSATVPRELKYTSHTWYGTQKWCCASRPSAAVLGDLLCVVTQNVGNPSVLTALLDRRTQMWEHSGPGATTSSSPGIVAYEGKFHLFYRHNGGNAIFHRASADGRSWSDEENLGFNTGGGVCPVVFGDRLHLFYVDEDARGGGGQIRYRTRTGSGWWVTHWSGPVALGINTRKDISAAVLDNRLVVVCKDNGAENDSGGVMVATQLLGQGWEWGQFGQMKTSGAPGVVAHDGRFELYYRHHDGNAIYTAWSSDGKSWNDRDQNTRHDSMIGGVCPVVFDGKLHAFYPYLNSNKGRGYYQDRLTVHTELPSAEVDLSDHYPLLIEGEMKRRTLLCNLAVHLQDIGDALFPDGVWAGRRGEALRMEGFQIDSATDGLGFSYVARITGVGDKRATDGHFAGVRGESKTMEGFSIELTGSAAPQYRLSYRAHIQDHGDSRFYDAGEHCGVAGKRVEAIWLKLEKV